MQISSVSSTPLLSTSQTSALIQTDAVSSTQSSDSVSNTTTTSNVIATIPTKWGFKVDANGFFGTDFNKAAGIPDNVKINQKQMDMVEQYTQAVGSSDDPVKALGKVWNFFSTVSAGSLSATGTMNIDQVNNMPYSYQYDGSLLDNPVNVQKSWDEMDKVVSVNNNIQAMSNNTLNSGVQGLFGGLKDWDPNGDQVKDEYKAVMGTSYDASEQKGQLGIGELFGVFCGTNMQESMNDFQSVHSYYSLMQSGQDFKSYLTNTFGSSYMKQLSDNINTMPDGKVIPNMIDDLFKTIDEAMKTNYAQYQQSQNSASDSILKNGNNTASLLCSIVKSGYQSIKISQMPTSGSLISFSI